MAGNVCFGLLEAFDLKQLIALAALGRWSWSSRVTGARTELERPEKSGTRRWQGIDPLGPLVCSSPQKREGWVAILQQGVRS